MIFALEFNFLIISNFKQQKQKKIHCLLDLGEGTG